MERFSKFAPPLSDKEKEHVAFCLEAGMHIDEIIKILHDRRQNLHERDEVA